MRGPYCRERNAEAPSLVMNYRKLVLMALVTFLGRGEAVRGDEYTSLFNGRDLEGWYTVVADQGRVAEQNYFTIEDGAIRTYASQVDGSRQPFAGLVTEKIYGSFHLKLEYRWGQKVFAPRDKMVRDAGIMYHIFGDEVIWPDCLELQIQEGDTGDIWAVNVKATAPVQNVIRNYSPKGKAVTRGGKGQPRFARFHRSYCWEVPGWNSVEIIVRGSHSVFKVNGHVVNEITDAVVEKDGELVPLIEGRILLQAEGAEIFYRNVVIKEY